MDSDYFDLFIPDVKTYGFVFTIDDEPTLFIVGEDKKMLDGICLYSEDEEQDFDEYDIYQLLDNDETILVSVDVVDDDFNEIDIKTITDENYNDFIYNLTPLKMHTLDHGDVFDMGSSDLETDEGFTKMLLGVVDEYKYALEKSIF